MTHSYTCDECHETFETTWTDEEALAEAKENFPTLAPRARALVCDECYKKMLEERATLT